MQMSVHNQIVVKFLHQFDHLVILETKMEWFLLQILYPVHIQINV